jgi:hypothetical protein
MTLTEDERRFLRNEFLEVYQNDNLRSLYGLDQVQSILSKLQLTSIIVTSQENSLLQSYLTYRKEGLARLTDQRLQHILQSQNSQGFGAPGVGGPSKVGGPGGGGGGDKNHFFNPYTQYNYCVSILSKLKV